MQKSVLPLTVFKIFFLSLIFSSFILIYLGVVFLTAWIYGMFSLVCFLRKFRSLSFQTLLLPTLLSSLSSSSWILNTYYMTHISLVFFSVSFILQSGVFCLTVPRSFPSAVSEPNYLVLAFSCSVWRLFFPFTQLYWIITDE